MSCSPGDDGIKIDGLLDLDVIYGKNRESRPGGVTGINVNLALDSEMSEVERKSFLEELHSRYPVLDTIAAVTPTMLTAE